MIIVRLGFLGGALVPIFLKNGEFVSKGKDFGKFKFIKANATVLPINKLNKF